MKHRPYKWLVTPVVQKCDGEEVVGELMVTNDGQPIVVYGGIQGLIRYAESFETVLGLLEQEEKTDVA